MGGEGAGNAVTEDDDEEKEEGDREADGEEVGEDEVSERQSPAGLSGELGFGVGRGGEEGVGPPSPAGAAHVRRESHCRCCCCCFWA